jgi:hypothetical protein
MPAENTDLTAATGASEQDSVTSTLNTVEQFGTTAANLFKAFTGGDAKPAAQTSAPAAAKTDWAQYIPWAIGGLIALVVVAMLMRGGSAAK